MNINMENENKEKVVLTDEELKKVAGGVLPPPNCGHNLKPEYCEKHKSVCIWRGGKCVPRTAI